MYLLLHFCSCFLSVFILRLLIFLTWCCNPNFVLWDFSYTHCCPSASICQYMPVWIPIDSYYELAKSHICEHWWHDTGHELLWFQMIWKKLFRNFQNCLLIFVSCAGSHGCIKLCHVLLRVHLSVCTRAWALLQLDGFLWNFMLSTFTKISQGTPDLVIIWQNISGTLHDDISMFFCWWLQIHHKSIFVQHSVIYIVDSDM
jgi:hypothetical protein